MRKLKKKVVAVVLAAACIFTAAPFSQPAVEVEAAAVKPKLNKKKVTLTVGKTCKLKVKGGKGKKWKSSKKKVATVSKTGKVTAKKAGKTVISVKVGKKTLKCTVTVKAKKKVQEPVTPETSTQKPKPETPETKVPETPETKVPETPATDSETFETDAPAKADEVDSASAKSDSESDYPEVSDLEYTLAIKNDNYEKAFRTFESGWSQDIAGYTMDQEDTYTYVFTLSTKNFSYNPYSLQFRLTDRWYNKFLTVKNVKISKAKNPDGTPDVNNDSDWDSSPTCWKRSYFKHVADENDDEDFSYELPMLEYAGNLKNFKDQIFRFEIKYTIDESKLKEYATLSYRDGKDCYLGWDSSIEIEYRPIADEDYQGSIVNRDNKENSDRIVIYKKVSKLPLARRLLENSMTIRLADSDSAEFKTVVDGAGLKRNYYLYPAGTDTISSEVTLDTTGYEKAPLEFGLWLDMYEEQYKSVTVYRMKKSSYEAQLADSDAQKKYYQGAEWMADDNWKTEKYRDPDASFGEDRYYNCLMYKGSETSFADHIYKFVITYDTSEFGFRYDDITNKASYTCKQVTANFRYKQDEDVARSIIFRNRNPWERNSGDLYWGVKVTEN